MFHVAGPARAVALLSLVTAVSLVSPVLWLTASQGSRTGEAGSGPAIKLVFAVGSAVLATVLALLVMRRDRTGGWAWVLLAGTLVCAALAVPLIGADGPTDSWWWYCARGAGPMLVGLGMLGAGNWLLHAGGVGAAAPVIAANITVGTLSWFVVRLLWRLKFPALIWWSLGLGLVGVAAAIGIVTRLAVLRRAPEPASPSRAVMVVGIVAPALVIGPALFDRIGPEVDQIWHASTGLAVAAIGTALAAMLGRRAFVAVLAISLIGYGLGIPLGYTVLDTSASVNLIVFLVGAALGGLAAVTRRLHRFAGVAGGLVAVGFTAWVLHSTSQDSALTAGFLPGPLSWLVVGGSAFVLAAGAVTVAAEVGAGGSLPIALGLVVPAIWLGLSRADGLVRHGALESASDGANLLVFGLISGLTLLGGAWLIAAQQRPRPQPEDIDGPGEPQPA